MEITKLDKQLFKNIGSDNANPKNNLRRAVNSITTDSMPQSDSIRFTPHLKDCLKEVDKAVTAHCDTGAKKKPTLGFSHRPFWTTFSSSKRASVPSRNTGS